MITTIIINWFRHLENDADGQMAHKARALSSAECRLSVSESRIDTCGGWGPASFALVVPTSAAWSRMWLLRGFLVPASSRFSKYFQLATVRPDGRPANRTVVFRYEHPGVQQLSPDARLLATSCMLWGERSLHASPWIFMLCYFEILSSLTSLRRKIKIVAFYYCCRGFMEGTNDITFVTDKRYNKVSLGCCLLS